MINENFFLDRVIRRKSPETNYARARYRELYSMFDLFFHEVRLSYGKNFCMEVKREALQRYLEIGDPKRLDELDELEILREVRSRYPEIERHLNEASKVIMGMAA